MAKERKSVALEYLDSEIARVTECLEDYDRRLTKLNADRADEAHELASLQRERALLAAALGVPEKGRANG